MDVYRFINSKDVAEYLHEIGHEFNAMETAYLVEMCDDATIDERIGAWREIIETMPDCPMAWNHNIEERESTHGFLREYIDLQCRMLDMFEENEKCIYYLRECRYAELPDRPIRRDDGRWTEDWLQPFSTLEGCIDHLRRERGDGKYRLDRYVVAKARIDFAGNPFEYRMNEIVLDELFRPLEVTVDGLDDDDGELANHLRNSFLKFPIPFKYGDIVIDRTDRDPRPFVFDHLKFWNSAELAEHGCEALAADEAERLDARVARCDERSSWDDSHMVACGYELGAHNDCSPLRDPCDLCADAYGANYNYLNLGRYDGPLDGNLSVLGIASEFMKGEIDVECLMNFTRLAALNQRASSLERSYDAEYVPEVRHLYQGAKR